MEVLGVFCWLIYIFCGFVAYLRLKKITNPVSLFCGSLALSSMAVLWMPPVSFLDITVLATHAVNSVFLLALLLTISPSPWRMVGPPYNPRRVVTTSSVFIVICAGLNIVTILKLGGLQQYLLSLPTRSVSHDDVRILKLISRLVLPAWILLVAAILASQSARWFSLRLVVMTLLMLSVQVSQGGRSALILPVLAALIIWEDYRRPVRPFIGSLIVTLFVSFLAVYEVFRRNFDLETFGVGSNYASWRFADYTNFASRLIDPNLDLTLALGETYLAAVTNFIPRAIWSDKPQGGGAYLDDVILGDLWTTATITPGNIVESVLNFGFYLGPAVSIVIFMVICMLTVALKLPRGRGEVGQKNPLSVFSEAKYIAMLFFLIGQPVAEFANAFSNLIMMLATIVVIEMMSKIKIQRHRRHL